jgi:PIN domain nuclease of toxin-antitoxin system
MALLLDTHVVLWWLADDDRLDSAIKDRLDVEAEIFVSSASVWEVGINQALDKLTAEGNLAEHVRDSGFAMLPISADHAIAASAL